VGYSQIWLQQFYVAQNREQVLWQKGVEDESPTVDCGSTEPITNAWWRKHQKYLCWSYHNW